MDFFYCRSDFVGSIASIALGIFGSRIFDHFIDALVNEGIVVSTASGNLEVEACKDSPGNSGSNINVGSHGYEKTTCKKPMSSTSNYGRCVDIMAPGVKIISARHTSNTGKLFIYIYIYISFKFHII